MVKEHALSQYEGVWLLAARASGHEYRAVGGEGAMDWGRAGRDCSQMLSG